MVHLMNIRKKIAFIAVMVMANNVLANQDMDASIPKDLAMGIKHYSYSSAAIEGSEVDVTMDYTQVKLPLGKFEFGDYTFVPTLSLEESNFDLKNDSGESGDPKLYTVKSQFMFIKKLDDKWMRIIQVTPSLHTDGKTQDEEAFSLMGLAIWKYDATDVSSWTMGVGANRLFGEYQPIPLISYQYRPSMQTQIDVGFPITKIEQRFHNDWTGFASVKPVGGNWRFEGQNDKRVNVSYSSWVASTGVRYQFKPRMWASLEVGQGLARKFDIDDEDDSGEVDIDDSTAIMFSIGFHP